MNKAWMLSVLLLPAGCFDATERPLAGAGSKWRYDPQAVHYEHVPLAIQQLVTDDPRMLAERVCASLAGELDFIASGNQDSSRVAFNCRMTEPGFAVSMEFGDLVRLP